MIHHFHKSSDNSLVAIGDIKSDLAQHFDELDVSEQERIKNFHPNKRAEFLASRYMIKSLCHELDIPFHGICKDGHGKPHLIDSDYHISISHSYPYVACMIHKNVPCGIDIESPREQLLRIRHKFLNDQEFETCGTDINKLCLYWCIKESIYKLYGRKNLSFSKNIFIEKADNGFCKVKIVKGETTSAYQLSYLMHQGHFITYTI